MNYSLIAIKNVRKNASFYTLYLCSISLVITIYFAFTSFSMNHVMLKKISEDGRVETMCSTISVFLMIFVVFYMSYSNRFFLRRRIKELGIYALLGYRKSSIISLLTFEHIMICVGAFLVGLFFGAVLHKGIVIGIVTLLHLPVDVKLIPFFNGSAILRTALFILFIVFILALSNGRFLFSSTLMDLVRFEKKEEKKRKIRLFPAMLGLLLIVCGYGLSLDILRGMKSLWVTVGFFSMGMLVMFFIVMGTVLFIFAFLPYVIQKRKNHKENFYRGENIITTPNFIYRIRSNSKTLIMLTLLSAATLTVSSVMALTLYYPIVAVSRMAPSEIELRIVDENQVKRVKALIDKYARDDEKSMIQTGVYKVSSSSDNLPPEYSIGMSQGDSDNEKIVREKGFECISFSQYRELLKAQGKQEIAEQCLPLGEKECILVKYQPNGDKSSEIGDTYPLIMGDTTTPLNVIETTLHNPISFANSVGTLIVHDSVYEQMKQYALPETKILSINGEILKDNEVLYQEISSILGGSPYLQGNSHRTNEIFSMNSSTFLLIGFLVVLFFIATGSILYFLNTSAVADSKSDYQILYKMGYSCVKIKRIIKKQVFTFFCIPFLLGLIDCLFATLVYKSGLMQNLLGNTFSLLVPSLLAIILSALIYVFYYLLTIRTCCRMAIAGF